MTFLTAIPCVFAHVPVFVPNHVLVLQADLKGVNAAKNYWQAYFDKYTYEHEVLAGAADKEDVVAFSFWLDKVTVSAFLAMHDAVCVCVCVTSEPSCVQQHASLESVSFSCNNLTSVCLL